MMRTAVLAAVAAASFAAEARPVPSSALKARLDEGPDVIGIVHWGLNTFSDREWGYGDEDPKLLCPAKFDADQIVGACKKGGLGGLVVVAKHHDGFCLWPTKTTEYNVAKSPFGRDYVREMERACRRAGIKFGVYVSPWDRNSAHYATEKYVEIYHAQVRELLCGDYGDVFEMWCDGANGGDGWYGGAREKRRIGKDYYRYGEVFRFARAFQPKVTIFCSDDDGDFRWPGNERGILDPDSRATIGPCGGLVDGKWLNPDYKAVINTGHADGTVFRVCEADFPLRKGWFYHESERGTTKKAAYLVQRYIRTVGNGGTMNIGIAPNKDGLVDDDDARELADFERIRSALFAHKVTEDGEPFNVVEMREDLANGEQVDGWRIVADGREILSGKSIGVRRIRLLDEPVSSAETRLEITNDGGRLLPVAFSRFYADPKLVKSVLSAVGDCGETDAVRGLVD